MFILEQRYGNDGYAFWFKLLETLGDSDGHQLNLNDIIAWEFLQSKTRLPADTCTEILNLLAKLDAIDSELWQEKIVWSDNFLKQIAEVYRNRRVEAPTKPTNYTEKPVSNRITTCRKPQRRGEESIGENNPPTPQRGNGVPVEFENFWSLYPKKIGKQAAVKKWKTLKRSGQLPPLQQILEAVENQKTWEQWQKDGGQFIPHPETWLNQGRWEDKPTEGAQLQWTRELSKQPSTN